MLKEKYLMISRQKKILIFFLIGLSLVFMSLHPVYSWGPADLLTDWFTETKDNITDEIFGSINNAISEAVSHILEWFVKLITEPFAPTLSTFEKYSNGYTDPVYMLERWGAVLGYFIATLIFFISLLAYMFNKKVTDMKDNPLSLLFRYCISIFMIITTPTIVRTILNLSNDVYVATSLGSLTLNKPTASSFDILSGSASTATIFGISLGTSIIAPGAILIVLILSLILMFKLIKGFVKLYMEMVSRYIVTMVFLMFFGAFAGTFVSMNTSQVFKSYIKTLMSSMALLLFNILWMKFCFFVLSGGGLMDSNGMVSGFIQYLFLLQLLDFGLKIDGMLRSMGLGVATGVGNLASSCGFAGRNIANSLHGANQARKNAGSALKAAGIVTGNKAMFDSGNKLGASFDNVSRGENMTPTNHAQEMAAEMGRSGRTIKDNDVSSKEAADIISGALNNPNNRFAQDALKGLSNDKIKDGMQEILGDKYDVQSARKNQRYDADGARITGVNVTAIPKNANGDSSADNSSSKDAKKFNAVVGGKDEVGEKFGESGSEVTITPEATAKPGEVASYNANDNGREMSLVAGQPAYEALSNADKTGLDISNVEKVGRNGKDNQYRVKAINDNGNERIAGTIDGNEFIKSSGFAPEETQKHMNAIGNQIKETGDYDKVDVSAGEKAGTWVAKATDSDGNTTQYSIKDKGTYCSSKLNDEPNSFMFTAEDNYGNTMKFDVNENKTYAKGSNSTKSSSYDDDLENDIDNNYRGPKATGQSFGEKHKS